MFMHMYPKDNLLKGGGGGGGVLSVDKLHMVTNHYKTTPLANGTLFQHVGGCTIYKKFMS